MIDPKLLDEVCAVMRKHGAEVVKHGETLIQLSQFVPMVAQSEPQLPSTNPYATLSDIDSAYGIPSFAKDNE
jgi:hypothetical protein